jgi:hypothetical protein
MRRVYAASVLFVSMWLVAPARTEESLVTRAERAAAIPYLNLADAMYGRDTRWGANAWKGNEGMRIIAPPLTERPEITPVFPPVQPKMQRTRENILPLLKHKDPKVRTLGLVLLFGLARVDVLADITAGFERDDGTHTGRIIAMIAVTVADDKINRVAGCDIHLQIKMGFIAMALQVDE